MDAQVKCDEQGCEWFERIPREDIPRWHKKPCPKCGRGEILTDAELIEYRVLMALETVSKEIDPDGKQSFTLNIDTAESRSANVAADLRRKEKT